MSTEENIRISVAERILYIRIDESMQTRVGIYSVSRTECFAPLIARALLEIYNSVINSSSSINPSLDSAITTTTTIGHTSSASPVLRLDIEEILSNCAKYLVGIFDKELIFYQDLDLKNWRTSWQEQIESFNNLNDLEKIFKAVPCPDFAVYYNNDPNGNILSAYLSLKSHFIILAPMILCCMILIINRQSADNKSS